MLRSSWFNSGQNSPTFHAFTTAFAPWWAKGLRTRSIARLKSCYNVSFHYCPIKSQQAFPLVLPVSRKRLVHCKHTTVMTMITLLAHKIQKAIAFHWLENSTQHFPMCTFAIYCSLMPNPSFHRNKTPFRFVFFCTLCILWQIEFNRL